MHSSLYKSGNFGRQACDWLDFVERFVRLDNCLTIDPGAFVMFFALK